MRLTVLVLAFLISPILASAALAEDEGPALNPSHKAKIFMAGLSLSRGLPAAKDNLVKVILAGDCETADALARFEGKKLNGATVEFKHVAGAEILHAMEADGTTMVFVCADAGKRMADIVAVAEKKKIVTIADDAAGVQNGLMFGVEVRGERAGLVLNLAQAKAIGLEFDPRFYVVTRVIK